MMSDDFRTLLKKPFLDEEGAILTEFGLMLPLMVILMLFLIICYELVDTQIDLQVQAYSEMRSRCTAINNIGGYEGRPRPVVGTKNKTVFIRGEMARILSLSHVPLSATVSGYAGAGRTRSGGNQYYKVFGDRYYWF